MSSGRFINQCPCCGEISPLVDGKFACRNLACPEVERGPIDGAVKFDENKNPLHLLPFDALEGITEILAFGARKYAERNWEKGMAWHRPFRACLGHLWAWWRGEEADPETGKSHLLHAGCCILFLIAYERRGVGSDDRPKAGSTFRA